MRNCHVLRWVRLGFLVAVPLVLGLVAREQASWRPRTLRTELSSVNEVVFSGDGTRLVAFGTLRGSHRVQIWDVAGEKPVVSIALRKSHGGFGLSPDNRLVLGTSSSSGDSTAWNWDARDGHLVRALPDVGAQVFLPDGRSFYVVNSQAHSAWRTREPDVRRIDARTLQVLEAVDVQPPRGLFFGQPDERGRTEVSCGLTDSGLLSLSLWARAKDDSGWTGEWSGDLLVDLHSGKRRVLPAPVDAFPGGDVLSDAEDVLAVAATLSHDGPPVWSTSVRMWDVMSGRLRHKWEVDGEWSPLFFSPDGTRLIMWGRPDFMREESPAAFDARSGRLLFDLQGRGNGDGFSNTAPSPDGSLFATQGNSSSDTRALLWDARTGKIARRLIGHRAPVVSLDWSPDGSTLATASSDGTVKLWRVR